MRNIKPALSLAAAISLVLAVVAFAADTKFRADGTIQRMASDMVLVRTTTADIEIKRDAKTKVTGDLREDSEFVLSREVREDGSAPVLMLAPASEQPAPEIVPAP